MKPGPPSRVPEPGPPVREILPEHLPDGALSIAVFGPGRGEAIVVKLPNGAIGVVDGCREPTSEVEGEGDPVRQLLARIEAERTANDRLGLAFVCLTHPHEDHYAGLGSLLRSFHGRVEEVWRVTHMQPQYHKELVKWIKSQRRSIRTPSGVLRGLPDTDDVRGLERVFLELEAAHREGGSKLMPLGTNTRLLKTSVAGNMLTIEACGPAAADVDRAGLALIRRGGSSTYDPNLTSGALLIRWGRSGMLLGGDLLCGDGPNSGWQLAGREITEEVQVVNVAHHASEGAHDATLWHRMRPALAVVTPFQQAQGSQPPRPEQIALLARDSVVAITSPPAWRGQQKVPAGMYESRPSQPAFDPKSDALRLLSSRPASAIRNAVAVSMDAQGNITRLVLAGDADIYLAPDA